MRLSVKKQIILQEIRCLPLSGDHQKVRDSECSNIRKFQFLELPGLFRSSVALQRSLQRPCSRYLSYCLPGHYTIFFSVSFHRKLSFNFRHPYLACVYVQCQGWQLGKKTFDNLTWLVCMCNARVGNAVKKKNIRKNI